MMWGKTTTDKNGICLTKVISMKKDFISCIFLKIQAYREILNNSFTFTL